MSRPSARLSLILVLSLLTTVPLAGSSIAYKRPGTDERVSLSSDGEQISYLPAVITECEVDALIRNSNHGCSAAMTPDGRFVVFASAATNVVEDDLNEMADVFLRDRRTARTELISVSGDGLFATGAVGVPFLSASLEPQISADGRFVIFTSNAINLVPGDTNLAHDIFVRDRKLGTTERISVGPDGKEANDFSYNPAISANGKIASFASLATNLLPGDSNGVTDVFVRYLKSDRTEFVSLRGKDQPAEGGDSYRPSMSADGMTIAFTSLATNLLDGDENSSEDVFVRNLRADSTELISANPDGSFGKTAIDSPSAQTSPQSISADGRYVAFSTSSSQLVPNDGGGLGHSNWDIYVRDRKTQTTERVSIQSTGQQLYDGVSPTTYSTSFVPAISANGRFVPFQSSIYSWTDPFTQSEVLVHDRWTGATERVAISKRKNYDCNPLYSSGMPSTASPASISLSISADGRFIAFDSCDPEVTEGDTNEGWDVFVHDRGVPLGAGGFGSPDGNEAGPDQVCLGDICVPAVCISNVCIPPGGRALPG